MEESIASLGVLRERLVRLGDELSADQESDQDSRATALPGLLDALRAIGGTGPEREHTLGRHLDADQVHVLGARAAALGPAAHYLLELPGRRS